MLFRSIDRLFGGNGWVGNTDGTGVMGWVRLTKRLNFVHFYHLLGELAVQADAFGLRSRKGCRDVRLRCIPVSASVRQRLLIFCTQPSAVRTGRTGRHLQPEGDSIVLPGPQMRENWGTHAYQPVVKVQTAPKISLRGFYLQKGEPPALPGWQ